MRPFVNETIWPNGTLPTRWGSQESHHTQGAACLFSILIGLKSKHWAPLLKWGGTTESIILQLKKTQCIPRWVPWADAVWQEHPAAQTLFLHFPVGFQMTCLHPTSLVIITCLYPSNFLLSCWAESERKACVSGKFLDVQWFSTLVLYSITWEAVQNLEPIPRPIKSESQGLGNQAVLAESSPSDCNVKPGVRITALEPGSQSVGPEPAAVSITWEIIRNANSQVPPWTYWIRNCGDGPQQSVLTRLLGDSPAR